MFFTFLVNGLICFSTADDKKKKALQDNQKLLPCFGDIRHMIQATSGFVTCDL